MIGWSIGFLDGILFIGILLFIIWINREFMGFDRRSN